MRGRTCILIAGSSAQPPRATPNPTPTNTTPAKAEVTPTRPKNPLDNQTGIDMGGLAQVQAALDRVMAALDRVRAYVRSGMF